MVVIYSIDEQRCASAGQPAAPGLAEVHDLRPAASLPHSVPRYADGQDRKHARTAPADVSVSGLAFSRYKHLEFRLS